MDDEDAARILAGGATFYDILGVDEDASEKEIKAAYKEFSRKFHPDVSDHPDAKEIFTKIQAAHEVLTDPRSRQTYDSMSHAEYIEQRKRWETAKEEDDTTHADQVEAQARSRERKYDQSSRHREAESTSTEEEIEEDVSKVTGRTWDPTTPDDDDTPPLSERVAATARWLKRQAERPFRFVEAQLSDDVISSAVRTAWTERTLYTMFGLSALFGVLLLIGSVSLLRPPSVWSVIGGIAAVVFLLDQYSVNKDVDRGAINVATDATLWKVAGVLSLVTVAGTCLAAWNGHTLGALLVDPMAALSVTVISPVLPAAVDNAATIVLLATAIFTPTTVLVTVSRLVWHDRYVYGFRVLPGVWDYLMGVPAVIGIGTAASQTPTPLPDALAPLSTIPLLPTILGGMQMSPAGGLTVAVLAPALTTLLYIVRRTPAVKLAKN